MMGFECTHVVILSVVIESSNRDWNLWPLAPSSCNERVLARLRRFGRRAQTDQDEGNVQAGPHVILNMHLAPPQPTQPAPIAPTHPPHSSSSSPSDTAIQAPPAAPDPTPPPPRTHPPLIPPHPTPPQLTRPHHLLGSNVPAHDMLTSHVLHGVCMGRERGRPKATIEHTDSEGRIVCFSC